MAATLRLRSFVRAVSAAHIQSAVSSTAFVPLRTLSTLATQEKVNRCASSRTTSRLYSTLRTPILPVHVGEPNTLEYRVFFEQGGKRISPWHDLPLFTGEKHGDCPVLWYINEIPRGTKAKMEIATKEKLTPIKQDVKKGALRFYKYSDSLVNYGALPQTWENPDEDHPDTGCGGDNDPLDVIEIGSRNHPVGAIYKVKPVGCLALLDEGETDWKILAVNIDDPKAHLVNDIEDVLEVYPGVVEAAREWFRMYKTAEGKGVNMYAFDGVPKNRDYALKVILENHEHWKQLRTGATPDKGLSLL